MNDEPKQKRRSGGKRATVKRMTAEEIPEAVEGALADRSPEDRDTTVVITPTRTRADEQFLLLFVGNFLRITLVRPELTRTDLMVYFCFAEFAAYGNAISISQRLVAERIGSTKSTVSRAVKRLINAGLMIRHEGALFLNLTVLLRGRLQHLGDRYFDQLLECHRRNKNLYGDAIRPPVPFVLPEEDKDEKNRA